VTHNNDILATTDAVVDALRDFGARGRTLQALVRDAASRHQMAARVREGALAAARVHDRLIAGTRLAQIEREIWRTGIVALSDWIEARSSAPDAQPSQRSQAAECAGRRAHRLQGWVVLAVVVPLVALAATIFHDDRLHAASPNAVAPKVTQPGARAARPRAPEHHARWGHSRQTHDSGERVTAKLTG
jgi:hypothetical protein